MVEAIDALDWYRAKSEGLGDLYEGLLEKNAEETKSGAGQYFTPRPLIESMVALIKPQPGELVQDPAAGTGGFLIKADRYVKRTTDELLQPAARSSRTSSEREAFYGVELVPDVQRLALMNAMLHDIEGDIVPAATPSAPTGAQPAEGRRHPHQPALRHQEGRRRADRDDITYPTSNKQLVFLQHIYRASSPAAARRWCCPTTCCSKRAWGRRSAADLMDKCDLHTILRLPTGIFYAQGVKTNVLFFTRGEKDKGNTKAVWFFDMRTNMPSFGKRTPFTREHFAEFEKAYGEDPLGKSKRKDQGEAGRFRKFTREEIAKRGDNLDIAWLKDDSVTDHADLPEPDVIAAEIVDAVADGAGGDAGAAGGVRGRGVTQAPGWSHGRLASEDSTR